MRARKRRESEQRKPREQRGQTGLMTEMAGLRSWGVRSWGREVP